MALRIADPEPVARLRLAVFDAYLNLKPREVDPALPVRIVDIDDASLARIGQWPWPRTRLAEIIDRLKADGARTVTLDLILAEPDRLSPGEFAKLFAEQPELAPLVGQASQLPSNDERLAAAIAAAPVVVGLAGRDGGRHAATRSRTPASSSPVMTRCSSCPTSAAPSKACRCSPSPRAV